MSETRKVILYIATTVDGYIAGPADDLSFLSLVEKKGEDYGYADFIKTVDTVILGRRTYDWVMKQVPVFPHGNKTTYVITHRPEPSSGKLRFYNGPLKDLVRTLKGESGKHIFCDGGAAVVNELLGEDLIDEFIVSIVPILLGDGVRLFQSQSVQRELILLSAKSFDTGLVQLHYGRRRAKA